VVMLTGDAMPVARAVAEELGIDTVFAGVLPKQCARGAVATRAGAAWLGLFGTRNATRVGAFVWPSIGHSHFSRSSSK